MPNQPNDTNTPTVRQVLDRAITGIENLRLLLEETETLTHCAGLSLDALPWASSGSAQGYNRSSGAATGSNPGSTPRVVSAAATVNPNPNAPNTDDDFDVDDFDSIAYPDPGDLTGANGLSQGEIGAYEPGDRGLALGRLQTLAIAAGKASKRSLLYCQRLQNYLRWAACREPPAAGIERWALAENRPPQESSGGRLAENRQRHKSRRPRSSVWF